MILLALFGNYFDSSVGSVKHAGATSVCKLSGDDGSGLSSVDGLAGLTELCRSTLHYKDLDFGYCTQLSHRIPDLPIFHALVLPDGQAVVFSDLVPSRSPKACMHVHDVP